MRKKSRISVKTLSAALALLFFLCAFSSCGSGAWQGAGCGIVWPLTLDLTLRAETGETALTLRMESPDRGSYRLRSPESLAGVEFLADGGEFFVRAGSVTRKIDKETLPDRGRLFDAFAGTSGACYRERKKTGEGLRVICTYVSKTENYLFTFDGEGKLLRVVCEGEKGFLADAEQR